LDDGGYIMVVLLIGMAVSAVWMSAMLPSWRQQVTREREADLIFRGEQYARAIALYWRKNGQQLPPSIDVLVSQRYLRRKYLDPITNKEFLPVGGIGSPSGLQGVGPQPPPGGRGQAATPVPQGPIARGGGISGVRSTSTATSIMVYRGQQSYSQFPFDYMLALQRMGAGLPQQQGATPPGRGRGAPARGGDGVQPIRPDAGRGRTTGPGMGTPVQAPQTR
jgi:type II secretory pathway pseudopilin PulG